MSAPIIVSARKVPFMVSPRCRFVACVFFYYAHHSLEQPIQSETAWLAIFSDFPEFLFDFLLFHMVFCTRSLRVLWPPFPYSFS